MTYKLDLRDYKILHELDKDSRQSYAKIAKKVRLSKNSVINRVNQMIDEKLITGFTAVVDMGKLGYTYFRIYVNLKNTTPKIEQEIMSFLREREVITWVGLMDGKYNLGAMAVVKDMIEMHDLWDEFTNKYVNYIDERLLAIMSRLYYYSKAYLVGIKKNIYEQEVVTFPEHYQLDKKDKSILKLLMQDARIPIVDIAHKLDLTPKTIIARIKELERRKIIVRYGLHLDLNKLGYQSFKTSFILFNLTKSRIKDFQVYAKEHPNIVYDEEIMGGDDYEIEVQVKDIRDLRKIIEEIKVKFTDILYDYRILHIYEENKNHFFPLKD